MSFTLLQLSDCHLLENTQEKLLGLDTDQTFQSVLSLALDTHAHIDLMVFSGDISNDVSTQVYTRLVEKLPEDIDTVWLPGNHDENQAMQQILGERLLASRCLGPWHISLLDSSVAKAVHGELTATELERFDQLLKRHPDKYHAVFLHHHLLPLGSAWLDTINVRNGEKVLSTMSDAKQVRFMANGHVHQEAVQQYKNIQLYSTPSTCFQFLPKSEMFALDSKQMPGYRSFTLHDDGTFETQVYRLPQRVLALDESAKGY